MLWIPAALDPDTAQKPAQTPALRDYTQSLEPHPPIALLLPDTRRFCRKGPGEHLGGEDRTAPGVHGWHGQGRTGKDRGGKGRNEGGRCWPDPTEIPQSPALPRDGCTRALWAGLAAPHKLLSRQRACIKAGLALLSPSLHLVSRQIILYTF